MLVAPGPLSMMTLSAALATPIAESAGLEAATSISAVTWSTSNHLRAMEAARSGLFWWSAISTSIGRPRTLPPKSSTAIRAAASLPAPVTSE
jgi:hypothetical protein